VVSVYIESQDPFPGETEEWLLSLESVLQAHGPDRARYLLDRLMDRARVGGFQPDQLLATEYVNTIAPEEQAPFPGDEELETRISHIIRWNAAVMVSRANHDYPGIGGHISSFASSAKLYDVAFNHFFRGIENGGSGDQIYFQGHCSPGIYARSFLEGRLTEQHLDSFRRETARTASQWKGLSSYPHARLMPDYWTFPTVSMGIGPIFSIYQARFNRYLHARGLADTSNSRVWCFVGDGESDEPESLGALSVAAREGLDNLIWVVNCNLQRLDGPVRGNGKIVQELETQFRGAGWNVIKVLWGSEWDPLFAADKRGLLMRRMREAVDGEYQRFRAESGGFIRKHFFGTHPELLELVSHLSDADIWAMRRGGHDMRKVYAAYQAAREHKGRPTVVLAMTVKGFELGEGFEATNATHQMKKMNIASLRSFRDRIGLPIKDEDLEHAPYFHPGENSDEVRYLKERRAALGGPVPARRTSYSQRLKLPEAELYEEFKEGTGAKREVSTTMAFVRLLAKLIKDDGVGDRIVPIIPDEARTFGMEPLFRQVGIYAAHGQKYEPVDKKQLLYYRETKDGQVLQEGITEAGAMSSFMAAGTSYATHDAPTIPIYAFYSMFGFQRIGDLAWAFADARGRGFLIGATAGRTTLNGEGLQHEDGHSHVLAATFPNVVAYDPSFAFEIALIVRDGLRRMYGEEEDVFYYLTVHNENYPQPPMPEGVEQGVIEGLYPFEKAAERKELHVQLLGSGSIMMQVLAARDLLAERFDVSADVWGATSYQQLRVHALEAERWNRLNPGEKPRRAWVQTVLEDAEGPFIAASDFMKLVPDQIARWVPGTFVPLGTDGFGMSDTREALRRHFEVDAESIALGALHGLVEDGKLGADVLQQAYTVLGFDTDKLDPMTI
jgi:pyruvate dehydrogenase E1 component